jgi:hypothetical protein
MCVWILAAAAIALLPGRYHWRGAYVLIATLLPLLVHIWSEVGIWYALGAGVAALSILRWPARFVLRWLRARLGGQGG